MPVYAKRQLHPMKSTIAEETARLSSGQFMFLTGLVPLTVPNKTVINNPTANIVEQANAAWAQKDYVQAVRFFRLTADQGDAISQAYLGLGSPMTAWVDCQRTTAKPSASPTSPQTRATPWPRPTSALVTMTA